LAQGWIAVADFSVILKILHCFSSFGDMIPLMISGKARKEII